MKTLITLFVFFSLFQCSQSQITWTETNGPFGYGTKKMLFIEDNPFVIIDRPDFRGNSYKNRQSIYRTETDGLTWNNCDINADTLFCIKFYITQNILYTLAKKHYYSIENYFFKSLDNGNTWIYDFKIIDSIFYFDKIFIAKDSTKYILTEKGPMRYDPISDKWIKIKKYFEAIDSKGNIYASSKDSVLVSNDKGESWQSIEYSFGLIDQIIIDKNDRIYVYRGFDILTSNDGGLNWKNILDTLNVGPDSYSIIDSNNILVYTENQNCYKISTSSNIFKKLKIPNMDQNLTINLYASKNNFYIANENGYYCSTDYGESWSEQITGPNGFTCKSLFTNDNMILTNDYYKNYLTSDFGENWSKVLDDIRYIVWGEFTPMYISSKGIIYVSYIGEASYQTIYSYDSLKSFKFSDFSYPPEEFVETRNKRLYCYGVDGLRYSDDHIKWTKYPKTDNKIRIAPLNLSIDKNDNIYSSFSSTKDSFYFYKWNPNTDYKKKIYLDSKIALLGNRIFVGPPDQLVFMGDSAIFKSSDDGDTWEEITNKFPKVRFNQIITDDIYNFWIATSKGVYSSNDGGNTWKAYNDGLKDLNITFLANSRKGFLYLAPSIGNIYKSNIFLGTKDEIKSDINSITISPNPASDFIEISGINPMLKHGVENSNIKIYNVLGEIHTTPNPTPALPASREGVRIDVSGLAPGMYFVKIGDKVVKFVKL